MTHPALNSDSVAVITGGAAGIGLGAAIQFAKFGMKVVIADNRADLLDTAQAQLLKAGASAVITHEVDVSDLASVRRLEADVADQFGGTDILLNNAGIQPGSAIFGPIENWPSRSIAIG